MNFEEMLGIVKKLSYKGEKEFCFIGSTWGGADGNEHMMDLKVFITIKDRITGEDRRIYRHHVFQEDELKQMTETRLLRAVRDLLIWLESHEVEEQLIYGTRRVFDPHAPLAGGTNVVKEKKQHEKKINDFKKQVVKQLNEQKEKQNEGIVQGEAL
jgi:hypothetical protein